MPLSPALAHAMASALCALQVYSWSRNEQWDELNKYEESAVLIR